MTIGHSGGPVQFALVAGERSVPTPNQVGTCIGCNSRMVPKCGTKVLWHWAHHRRPHCDPWWENETEWHRSWKSLFPADWREQTHFDASGERHIADVKTPSGIVLEFQNSPMPLQELRARESFYGTMLWIVNAAPFADQFFLLGRLPSPDATWAKDVVFSSRNHRNAWRVFWRESENPDYRPGSLVLSHSTSEIQAQIDNDYVGHHFYDWVRPRSVWFDSRVPVYLDFGGDLIWRLHRYDNRGLQCVVAVRKKSLVLHHGGEYSDAGEVVRLTKRPIRNGDIMDKGETEVLLNRIPVNIT